MAYDPWNWNPPEGPPYDYFERFGLQWPQPPSYRGYFSRWLGTPQTEDWWSTQLNREAAERLRQAALQQMEWTQIGWGGVPWAETPGTTAEERRALWLEQQRALNAMEQEAGRRACGPQAAGSAREAGERAWQHAPGGGRVYWARRW